MSQTYCKNHISTSLFIVGAGVLLAAVFLLFSLLFSLSARADEAQVQAAIADLNQATGQNLTSEKQARELCNSEQYLDVCADIGKKHNLYTPEEITQVNAFFGEVKGQILQDIKTCQDEECLIRVANELAQKIKTKNPVLAADFNLTAKIIEEKKSVVNAAQELGVNFQDCEAMNPDTAPIDLLRKCAKLAKDSRVQKYIPEDKKVLIDQFSDTTLVLKEGLASGKYKCGDNTLEGCGDYCLNPSSAAKSGGIPAVCGQIAKEVFGSEGVKQLELAYQHVGQVKDYYSKKFTLVLPNGRELAGESQIRNACDQAFSGRNLEIARACGNFVVKNGFASQVEVEKGLKLLESVGQRGQGVDFDKCLTSPEACRDLIPEGERERFDVGSQVFQIMKSELGFEPFLCERGAVDEAIGTKCLEGSKRALAKIESLGLGDKSKEARFIIEDIRKHVNRGVDLINKKDQFKQAFTQEGGPGGCKSEAECFAYCSDPAHGPECISFGAKFQIFKGNEVIERFQEYNRNIQKPGLASQEYKQYSPGPYPYPPYPDYPTPPGQTPGFTQPGPGFSPPPGIGVYPLPYPPFPGPGPGFVGPTPECLAAIQSGDFARAKTVCYVPPQPRPFPSVQICPATPHIECPAGQYRESFKNNDGCWVDGPCVPVPTYSPGPYPSYSPGPTFTPSGDPAVDCQRSGGTWDPGAKYCKFPIPTYSQGPYPTYSLPPGGKPQCSDGLDNDNDGKIDYPADISCYGLDDFDEYYPPSAGITYSPPPGGSCYTQGSEPACRSAGCVWYIGHYDGTHCDDAAHGQTTNTSPTPPPPGTVPQCSDGKDNDGDGAIDFPADTGCYGKDDFDEAYYGPPTGSPYPTYTPGPGVGSCPAGHHYHGESGGFCMNDQENYGGFCYAPNSTTKISCPAPTTYTPGPTYSPPTSSGTCPSGAHIMYVNNAGGYCMSDADASKCGPLNSTSVSGFGACSGFQSTTTYSPAPGTSYTPPPSCPAGQWWDSATSSCHQSSTTTYTPPPSCPSGQYWNGSSCVSSAPASTPYPTPYPATEPAPTYQAPPPTSSPPPPTSLDIHKHYVALARTGQALASSIMSCADSNGRWDAKSLTCRSGGMKGFFATIWKAFFGGWK